MRASTALAGRVMLAIAFAGAIVAAEEVPLHRLIDQHLAPVAGVAPGRSTDAEFVRRASLDLIGMIPTPEDARAFIADTADDKRRSLLDRLFASPQFARHLAGVLDVILMERRPYVHVPADEWQAWLVAGTRANKPWNEFVREILSADGDDPDRRPAARFALDRHSDPHVLTRDVGRIFFGRDMQCAQCHDHPLVPDYLQSDYHGLMAFVVPSYALVRAEGDKQTTLRAEKAGSDLAFESVFEGVPRRTGARMPDGTTIDEPFFLPGDEYQVAPAENVKSVPKFSRRTKLAELATDGTNPAFNENIANRLWAHMFGRGLVHPPDMHHPANPASDPELLRLLGERFAAMGFDIRAFLRELALTDAYQRAADLPLARGGAEAASDGLSSIQTAASSTDLPSVAGRAAAEAAELESQRAELATASEASSTDYEHALDAWHEAQSELLPAAEVLDEARNQYAAAKTQVDESVRTLSDTQSRLNARQDLAKHVERSAAALQQAVEAIAADEQLANLEKKLVARSAEIAAEVAELSQSLEESIAAVGPATKVLGSAAPAVGTALSKTTLLNTAANRAERDMLSARRQAARDAQSLSTSERRLETARRLMRAAELLQAIERATEAEQHGAAEIAAAQSELDDVSAIATASAATGPFLSIGASSPLAAQSGQESIPRLLRASSDRARRVEAIETARASLAELHGEIASRQAELDAVLEDLEERWSSDFTIRSLRALSPEQLCWSLLRATGIYDRQWQAEAAELDASNPLSDEQQQDAAQLAARQAEIEQRTYDKLKGNLATFIALYGSAAGQPQGEFFATADQALFAANGEAINQWIAPAEGNVTQRIVAQEDLQAAAEELYLTILSRQPYEEEAAEVAAHLAERAADKETAAQEIVWALLNSVEFRFSH